MLPLAAYLASFVLAFARSSRSVSARLVMPCLIFAVSTGMISGLGSAALAPVVGLVVAANVLAVGVAGFAAHARLAATRPDPANLTLFYLVVSVGGALGGLLNGVVASLLFDGVWEYFFTIALLPALAIGLPPTGISVRRVATLLGILAIGVSTIAVLDITGAVGAMAAVTLLCTIVVAGVLTWLIARAPAATTVTLLIASVAVIVVQESSSLLTERT